MITADGTLVELHEEKIAVWAVCRLGNILNGDSIDSIEIIGKHTYNGIAGYDVRIVKTILREDGYDVIQDRILTDQELFTHEEAVRVKNVLTQVDKLYSKMRDDGYRLLYSESLDKNKNT